MLKFRQQSGKECTNVQAEFFVLCGLRHKLEVTGQCTFNVCKVLQVEFYPSGRSESRIAVRSRYFAYVQTGHPSSYKMDTDFFLGGKAARAWR